MSDPYRRPGPRAPYARRTTPAGRWWPPIRYFLLWPLVFSAVAMGTFLAAAIRFDDPGGPLFWPLGCAGFFMLYAMFVGVPLALCSKRRRWWLRAIPAVIAAAPLAWVLAQAGAWAVPGTLAVAASIAVEAIRAPR